MREARAEVEAETVDMARAWAEAKAREKAEIARIAAEAREKVDPEAEAAARAKEKSPFFLTSSRREMIPWRPVILYSFLEDNLEISINSFIP